MFRSTRPRRFSSWLALAVFALNAFWPLLSLANPSGSQAWMEICSSSGMRQVPVDFAAPTEEGHAAVKIPQCPLYAFGSGMAMGTPPVLPPLALVKTQESSPSASLPSAARPAAYAPALPRAPPYHS